MVDGSEEKPLLDMHMRPFTGKRVARWLFLYFIPSVWLEVKQLRSGGAWGP